MSNYDACKRQVALAATGIGTAPRGGCKPKLVIGNLDQSLKLACRLQAGKTLWGMAVWRWLVFVGLFWPLDFVTLLFSRFLNLLVQTNLLGQHAIFITFGEFSTLD